ncbi:ring-hydroxylating oxygenase subunit alpha [Cupriavidus sp. TA19]|uniref:Rieske 2Fe-2S domain-containing protein n=1 Tax=Cupriavidus sp. TA19 TaxID=701108 RepID=UPI002729481A|nr:Rieske 2Fe-2S domain-containing protein [Cupriavidus sp. TA19]GLC97788.1 ring-hydroxylating oxygenase subunit alpha [Cupriavidus sp. TA19]
MDKNVSVSGGSQERPLEYCGYYKTAVPPADPQITQTGPGTPLGEYFRRFWQPVCMTEQLTDVPHPVRILGEDLVVYRDKEGTIGVLHRHCVHRGASLEYGIIQQKGIRCAYHAMHFAEDGKILSAPGERDNGARICKKLSQGAYPAIERDGLVFAYMGPPELKPAFPEYDAYQKDDDLELVPFSNVFPCNWLQTIDNIADQMHTSFLHNPEFLFEGNIPSDLDWKTFALTYFASVPVMDYVPVRKGTGMAFIASRRVSEEMVWVRINDLIVPNISQHASLFEDGAERRLFHRVSMSRWYVPVDDTHCIIYGWRMFGKVIDPKGKGDKSKVGWDKMDFLDGQVGDRTYEEGQRLPGDWEIIKSQRPIAVHALENPIESDVGVYLFRKLVREAITGKTPAASPERMNERANNGLQNYCYTQNTVLKIPARSNPEEEREILRKVGRRIVDITAEADTLAGTERRDFIISCLEELERDAAAL